MNISILGLGYIGLPTAIILALNGHTVSGFDVSKDVVKKLNEGQIHITEDGLQNYYEKVIKNNSFKAYTELQESDVYIISVPTPFKGNKEADLSYVMSAAELVAKKLKKGDIVILESTVPPATTRKMTDLLVEKSGLDRDDFYTAHCPERVLPGNIMYEMIHNDRIVGAEREESAKEVKKLYETFLEFGTVYITDDITAELSKLVENSYRDVNIAYANELSIICDQLNINVKELIKIANKHPRVNILSPGVGVGGHCIAVDPWFIVSEFKDNAKLIETARNVNDSKPLYLANKVSNITDSNDIIAVLGMSFKPNIDDFRESPSVVFAKALKENGCRVVGCDPNITANEIEGIEIWSFEKVLNEADFLVIAQNHKEFIDNKAKIIKKKHLYV